jgi:dipeptidyl aminopeptidase/acylaminoacyl peptidase
MKILIAAALFFTGSSFAQAPPQAASHAGKRQFTFEDMMALKRLSEPVPSPDGKWITFAAEDVNLDENTKKSHLWIVPATGGESRRLNETPNEEARPRFSPDGKRVAWTSKATDPNR